MRYVYRYLSGLFLAGLLASCATAPVQEMSDARQALSAARDAGADQAAPTLLEGAESALEQAEQELNAGAYAEARKQADIAREKAIEARKKALAQP